MATVHGDKARVLLIGGAGNKNFGDELMLRLWLDFYAGQGANLSVHAARPEFAARFFAATHAKARYLTAAWPAGGTRTGFWKAFRAGLSLPPDALEAMFGTAVDLIHLHGGGYFNSMWPHIGQRLGAMVAASRHYRCPIVATGIGFLPMNEPTAAHIPALATALEEFAFFETRDRQSYDFLSRFSDRIIDGIDDTFLLRAQNGGSAHRRTLHLSCFKGARDLKKALLTLPPETFEQFQRALFWVGTPDDIGVLDELRKRHEPIEAFGLRASVFGRFPVAPGDVMIAARFHPHFLAARHGATGLFRTDRDYYDVKHGSIVALGSPFRPVDFTRPLAEQVPAGSGEPSAIMKREPELVAGKAALAARIAALLG